MARAVARVLPLVSRPLPVPPSPAIASALVWRPAQILATSSTLSSPVHLQIFTSGTQRRSFHLPSSYSRYSAPFGGIFAALRGFRKVRRRQAARKQAPEEKKLELRVKISIDQGMPDDHEVVNIVEMLKLNAPMALKTAFDGLKEWECRAQDSSIVDIGKYEKIELCILLCNNELIKKLNKEWQRDDCFTDVLFRIQDVQGLEISTVTSFFFFFRKLINLPLRFIFDRVLSRVQLMLGDIVISAEAAARQAEEWGHSLLDEIRILLIRGVLHLLGFNHETSNEAGTEMKKLEELVLGTLGWKVRGLPKSAYDVAACYVQSEHGNGRISNSKKKASNLRFYRPKFSYIFCDMDGTLLNSQSQVTITTAKALREARSRGIKVIIATGKTRPAVISALKMVDLAGKGGIASEMSPGIFLQGMLVYGRRGIEIHRRNLDQSVCREALLYSLEHEVPLIAFCQDRCLTLFDHPLVDSLHTIYHEPKAEIMPSVEHLLAAADIQKLIFLDIAEGVSSVLRPHWEEVIDGRAGVVQAQPDILEIIPADASKGDGVKVLLDHLGISAKEIMAIGDGENDVEMLQLASLGVALGNGSEKAKAAADVIGATNDEDGVAMAIYQYAF